ncbi:MAG: histidine phosphatase family protein [Sphingomonas taxi]|uniref:Histidine phosphatase family protein n=1 Tax=Sphingomonas taxi TaxID=1549858 RepID=A0A2W5QXK2_9SPHN|nr:MAG: histidine phosphatase family protein [Sphingomonas taxi]
MSAVRIVHLMRHGTPVLAGRLLGRTDCDATPAGVDACRRAAAACAARHVACSDLRRATMCAAAITPAFRSDAAWRELDFGAWDGCDPATLDPEALAAFWRDPEGCAPPGGERWSALVARVDAAVRAVASDTLVVTHAGAIRAALAGACGFDARQVWAFDLPYATTVSLRLWDDGAQIVRLAP